MTRSVAVVAERVSSSGLPSPGKSTAEKRLLAWLRGDPELAVKVVPLTVSSPSRRDRSLAAWRMAHRPEALRGFDHVVVEAFSSPHMQWLAYRLARAGFDVAIDLCDSPVLAARSAWRHRALPALLPALAGGALSVAGGRSSTHLYISARDREIEERVGRRRGGVVLSPPLERSLRELGPVDGPLERVVISADLRSYHNGLGFGWFSRLLDDGLDVGVPVHLYGPMEKPSRLPRGVEFRGWAPELRDVYRGNCVLFAPNVVAQGVQIKVWEALTARRPVIVGAEVGRSYPPSDWMLGYDSPESLRRVLGRVADWRPHGRPPEPPVEVPPLASEVLRGSLRQVQP